MFYKKWLTNRLIKRWRNNLSIQQHQKVFHSIFDPIDGFTLSRQARTQTDAMEYVYGEIDFESFIAILSLANPNANTVFYDLGSGTGTASIACSMVFNVQKSIGIEKFEGLHNSANQQKAELKKIPGYALSANKIYFIHDDFLTANIDPATLIFINATGLFGETWDQLNQRLDQLPKRPIIITTSKPLSAMNYTLTHTTQAKMSWGIVDIYYFNHYSEPELQTTF